MAKRKMPAPPTPPPQTKAAPGRRLPAWLPLAVFILLGAWARYATTIFEPMIFPDSTQYLALAREISSGTILARDWPLEDGFGSARKIPPLYSLLIAPFDAAGIDAEAAGAWVSLLVSALLFLPLFFTARELFGRRAAFMAAGFLVIHPFALRYAGTVLTESTFATLFMALIWSVTVLLRRPSTARAVAAGALAALLYLTRDVGLVTLPLVIAAVGLKTVALDRRGWTPAAKTAAVVLAAFLLVALPWLIHIRVRSGQFGLTIRMGNLEILRHIAAPGHAADHAPPGPGVIRRTVGNFAVNGRTLAGVWDPLVTALVLGSIGLPGYAAFRRRREFFRLAWLPAWIVALWATYALLTATPDDWRYLYPLMGPGIILAAAAGDRAASALAGRVAGKGGWTPARVSATAAVVVTVAVVAGEIPGVIELKKEQSALAKNNVFTYGSKEAAADLTASGTVPPGAIVMDRKPFFPYYVRSRWYFDHQAGIVMPRTMGELEATLAGGQVDFLAVNSYTLRELEPQLLGLAFAMPVPKNCRVVYSRYHDEYQRVLTVYRVGAAEPPLSPLAPAEAVKLAQELFLGGDLVTARRYAEQATATAPDDPAGWELKTRVLSRFYECAKIRDDVPTMAFVPELLPALEQSAANYVRLSPNDAGARAAWRNIRQALIREQGLLREENWKK